MEFFVGFLFAWVLLGAFAIGGVYRDWYYREWFWVILSLPVIPLLWVVCWLRDQFR